MLIFFFKRKIRFVFVTPNTIQILVVLVSVVDLCCDKLPFLVLLCLCLFVCVCEVMLIADVYDDGGSCLV